MSESKTGRRCTICDHPELEQINLELVRGFMNLTDLAKKYNVGRMALTRHKENHIPKALAREHLERKAEAADGLLAEVEKLHARAWQLIEKAEKDKKFSAAASAIKEARNSLELIGKLVGEIKTGSTVNVLINPKWIQLRTLIYKELEPYPEARQRLAEALTKAGAEEDDGEQEGTIIDVEPVKSEFGL
jgi:hypothetical protein